MDYYDQYIKYKKKSILDGDRHINQAGGSIKIEKFLTITDQNILIKLNDYKESDEKKTEDNNNIMVLVDINNMEIYKKIADLLDNSDMSPINISPIMGMITTLLNNLINEPLSTFNQNWKKNKLQEIEQQQQQQQQLLQFFIDFANNLINNINTLSYNQIQELRTIFNNNKTIFQHFNFDNFSINKGMENGQYTLVKCNTVQFNKIYKIAFFINQLKKYTNLIPNIDNLINKYNIL